MNTPPRNWRNCSGPSATRIRVRLIAALLGGERSVMDLADEVGISESATSHHMRGLRLMQLVRARKEGRQVFYRLDDDHVAALFTQGLSHVQHG